MGIDSRNEIRLGLFVMTSGHHVASWRLADSFTGARFEEYVEMAKLAEAAKFDLFFIADTLSSRLTNMDIASRTAHNFGASLFEPISLLSALASVTTHIGLAGTASTTYSEPYNLARMFASLDHISNGRAAWNVVTTADDESAHNFGRDEKPSHDDRYERAEEFVDVVRGLWNSWDDDAIVRDQEAGLYFIPKKMHYLNHSGKHLKVSGPLNIPRSPQGQPILVQAGASGPGRELAARIADIVFTANQTLEEATAFYADLKSRAVRHGRAPEDILIMPGISPVVGATESEAREKLERLHQRIDPEVALMTLQNFMPDIDLWQIPLDAPVAELPITEAQQSRQLLALKLAQRENLTLRQLALRFAGTRGHWCPMGTAEQIVDQMEEYFRKQGADGFNVMPSVFPTMLVDFTTHIVPELQRRGLFRTEYTGKTLRDHLGLRRPPMPRPAQ